MAMVLPFPQARAGQEDPAAIEVVREAEWTRARMAFVIPDDAEAVLIEVVFSEAAASGMEIAVLTTDEKIVLGEYAGDGSPGVRQVIYYPQTAETVYLEVSVDGDISGLRAMRGMPLYSYVVLGTEDVDSEALLMPERNALSIGGVEPTLPSTDPEVDYLEDGKLTAVLNAEMVPVQSGLECVFEINSAPQASVLFVEVQGLDTREGVEVWINGTQRGWLQLETPPPNHPGYFKDEQGRFRYLGWRRGVAILEGDTLLPGTNRLVLHRSPRSIKGAAPMRIRAITLQLHDPNFSTTLPHSSGPETPAQPIIP